MRLALRLGLLLATFSSTSWAADFYVDPIDGSDSGDGSQSKPWRSLQQVLDDGLIISQSYESLPPEEDTPLEERNPEGVVEGGDTIWLLDGDHGSLEISGFRNEQDITISAAEGATPRFASVLVRGSTHWILDGLFVTPSSEEGNDTGTLINLDSHAHLGTVSDITVRQCHLESIPDALSWSADDWNAMAWSGISVDGERMTIEQNTLRNVNFGITVSASHSLVRGNLVDGFAGDGLRGLGDYTIFEGNLIKNCFDVNDNHDDGFQSWSDGPDGVGSGEVVGIVLRGNTIIGYEDATHPLSGALQGIGCFDGTFVDWVVENNVIITDHWHGISLYGARGVKVQHNTVVDLNEEEPGPPWIRVTSHKDGTPPEDSIVANNLATAFSNDESVVEEGNLVVTEMAEMFVDWQARDLRLLSDAAARDQAIHEYAPATDIDGVKRPQGDAPDVGAYEWHDGSAETDPWVPGAGHLPPAVAGLGGSGGQDADAGSEETSGCGCRVQSTPKQSPLALWALGALMVLRARRRFRGQGERRAS